MSMLSEQVKELRTIANNLSIGHNMPISLAIERFREAADTIETLFAKLAVANMERSERYYNGGWILCNNGESLPEEAENDIKNGWSEDIRPSYYVLCESTDGNIFKGFYSYVYKTWTDFKEIFEYENDEIIRWQPLPKPYKPK